MQSDEQYKQLWENRYSDEAYAYGTDPNTFFKTQLQLLAPGTILLPADGEGRNSVYAATLGWTVTSTDISSAGKTKALQLAAAHRVTLDYQVGTLEELAFVPNSFDVIGLLYAHVGPQHKAAFNTALEKLLKPGGVLIFEAFDKAHAAYKEKHPTAGGPTDLDMLYSLTELEQYYPGYNILVSEQVITTEEEGIYHRGGGAVVRFVARKPLA